MCFGIFPEPEGDQSRSHADAEIINKNNIGQGNLTEFDVVEKEGHREQSIVENQTGIDEYQNVFCGGVFHIAEILTNAPDIHDQADECSHADNDVIGIIVESPPHVHDDFKKDKHDQQPQKKFLLECEIEKQDDQWCVYEVIIQGNLIADGCIIPGPSEYLGRIDKSVDHPEQRDHQEGFIRSQAFPQVQSEGNEAKGYCQNRDQEV